MAENVRESDETASAAADLTPAPVASTPTPPRAAALREVALLFFVLGCTSFGGPAAHVALMREECVKRRKWLSDERFLDLFGAVNLIPGPSSTQLAIYLGYLRAGWPGLLLAGVCFIVPAMVIVLLLAWGYVAYGALPQVGWLLYGIKPVVIAVIAQAAYGLGRTALRGVLPVVCFVALLVLYFLGINVLVLLVGGALAFALLRVVLDRTPQRSGGASLLALVGLRRLGVMGGASVGLTAAVAVAAPVTLLSLFLAFLKLGAVVYGSGYTLLAFIRDDFVNGLHWLTQQQMLDAISIGQVTPGPVFTTATFIGYILLGWQGALVATLGIFLPSFALVPLLHLVATRLRTSRVSLAILAGVNVAALALMVGVSLTLASSAILDLYTAALAVISLVLLLRFKVNAIWLIVAGAVVSIGIHLLGLA